jgi:hypothetical protein
MSLAFGDGSTVPCLPRRRRTHVISVAVEHLGKVRPALGDSRLIQTGVWAVADLLRSSSSGCHLPAVPDITTNGRSSKKFP